MKSLCTDSKDVVEKKWAEVVCRLYPTYALFWNEFIGVRTKLSANKLLWYRYSYPKSWSTYQKQQYEHNLEELFMAHYTLFCNLAGAHFQHNECIASLKRKNIEEMHFRYWEAFECCYQHMGNARNYFYLFWDKIFAACDNPISKRTNGDVDISKVSKEIEKLFRSKRKLKLYKAIEKEFGRKGQIIIIRNNTVHYARVASWLVARNVGYALPYKLYPNVRWTQKKHPSSGILAHKKIEEHLKNLETIINEAEEIAITYFRNYLQNKKIIIQY